MSGRYKAVPTGTIANGKPVAVNSTGTVSQVADNSVSFNIGSNSTFESGESLWIGAVFDSSANRPVITYRDNDNSNYGTAIAVSPAVPTNITSENYVGFAEDTVATGQPVTVNTKGAIDENQSSLTPGQQYFVQTDGTLGTSADDPSVVAGTAVTATKLIVKG